MEEWTKKLWYVCMYIHIHTHTHTHTHRNISHKKEEILLFMTIWLDLEAIKQTKQNKNRFIDTENKWAIASRKG